MKFPDSKEIDVVGLGNALMDILVEVSDDHFATTTLTKGGMHIVEEEEATKLLESLVDMESKSTPGGSAANTIKGVAVLGGDSVLCAKVGADSHGDAYVEAIEMHGVTTRISRHTAPTGHALTFITPDAERTFSVHLGAAVMLGKEDILEDDIRRAKILHLEAFQLEGQTSEIVHHAIELAKKHNTLISIDLADSLLINRNLNLFKEVVEQDVDILFCNEEEATAFTGKEGQEALKEMGRRAKVAVLKRGAKGAVVSVDGEITEVSAFKTDAIDTTGAGDSFAAGFLYGHTHGWGITQSAKLGAHLASEVISKVGVDILSIDTATILKEATND